MAALICRTWLAKNLKSITRGFSFSARRTLLSEAYSCTEAWEKRLESPILKNVSLGDLSLELRDSFEKEKRASFVDMDILANKLHEMHVLDADYNEELIRKFRCCPEGYPVKDSIVHAVVRCYIDRGLTDRLLVMMKDRIHYGILPDSHATCLLMDHFINKENYADAAQVAYEMMLQEDFSHRITFLLSLLATTKHLQQSNISDLAYDLPIVDPEEEEDWIKVKVIRYPYYDDHFDLKDERFLLGKTLYLLGKEVKDNDLLSNSLKVIGLGLYHKFGKGLLLLDELANVPKKDVILNEALNYFDECIKSVATKEPDLPEKDFGLLTIDDEIYKERLTPDGREELNTEFEEIAYKLRTSNNVSEESLMTMVDHLLTSDTSQLEADDIAHQTQLYREWESNRKQLVEEQLRMYVKRTRKAEIERQLKELQEKEEMFHYFEDRDQIILHKHRAPAIPPPVVVDDIDTLQEKRRKRRKYRFTV